VARNQTGLLALGITGYIALGAITAIAVASGIAYVQTQRLASVKQEYALFQATVKAQGDAAEKAARKQEADDKRKKEIADETNTKLRADVAALAKRLRGDGPAAGGLPSAPATSSRPDLQCFAADEFRRSYGTLVTELRTIADRCAADAVDLQTVREWAAGR